MSFLLRSIAAAILLAPTVQAETWTVDASGASSATGSFSGADALWKAIDACGPGDVVNVAAGRYRWGVLGKGEQAPSGAPTAPITVRALGEVVIERQGWNGGATLTVFRGSWVTFEGFFFEGSWTGVQFHPNFPQGNVGWRFVDCEIDGMWDWHTDTSRHESGLPSKWGILSWGLADFSWERGSIHDIRFEHAMYHHNPVGDILVTDAELARCGRTAMQIRSAENDSGHVGLPKGRGRVTVQRCTIKDTGLWDGGSALTLAGRNEFQASFQDNNIAFGTDALLVARWLTRNPKRRFGGGAVVTWEETAGEPNGSVSITGNTITYGPKCGDREILKLGSARSLTVVDNRVLVSDHAFSGAHQSALVINPRDAADPERMASGYSAVSRVTLSGNEVQGSVIVDGVTRE